MPKTEFDYYYGVELAVKMAEEIKDLMVDVLCGERSVVSEGKRVSVETK